MTNRINFEISLIHLLEIKLECTTSDAQGIIEAAESSVNECFENGLTAEQTLNEIWLFN